VVGCAVGAGDTAVLQKVAGESVVRLSATDSSAIGVFFKWVSASIIVGSQKVESAQKEVGGLKDLPPPPPEINVVV
jgi:uncharacterized protein YegL